MAKVTITKCSYTDQKKDGSKIVNKWGKPAYRVGIKTNEYGDQWINGFLPFPPDRWEGTTQELEIYEEEFNGQIQKKFKLPSKGANNAETTRELQNLRSKVEALHGDVTRIIKHLDGTHPLDRNSDGSEMPNFDPQDAETPPDDDWGNF